MSDKVVTIKDPQNPRDGGDGEGGKWPTIIKPIAIKELTIGGGTGGGGIKHLSDPRQRRMAMDSSPLTGQQH